MSTNSFSQWFSFLLPKKENLPMYFVQIISAILMIGIFGTNNISDGDTTGIISMARGIYPISDWYGIGWPLLLKSLFYIHDSINFLYKIQTLFYIFFLGKICLLIFNNKNIKLSVVLFLIVVLFPPLFLFEASITKDSLYLSLFTVVLFSLLLYIRNQKNVYYIIFFIISILFTLTRQNAYIIVMPLLFFASWIFIFNNQKTLISYKKKFYKTILLIFLHIALAFSLLFIITSTYRETEKAYSSSTLMYNDILTIVTLGGYIRDNDINYYANKYIDRLGGVQGRTESTYWGLERISNFDLLSPDEQEEIIFVRYLLNGRDYHLLKKDNFKSRITTFEDNRAYIKKVWLYAIIDNPIIYLHNRFLFSKTFFLTNDYREYPSFDKNKTVRDFIIKKYIAVNNYVLWLVFYPLFIISSFLYFKFIKKNDLITIIITTSVIINFLALMFIIPMPLRRYFSVDMLLLILLTARNLISLIYYARTKNKI